MGYSVEELRDLQNHLVDPNGRKEYFANFRRQRPPHRKNEPCHQEPIEYLLEIGLLNTDMIAHLPTVPS